MSVQKELKKGLFVTFFSKYSNILFELIISFVLARLLTPSEFGVVALIIVFTAFFNIMGEVGIGAAIVQNKSLTILHIQTIFNYSTLIAFVMAIIFALICYPISKFYDNIEYVEIGRMLAVVIFFYIINVVPQALLRRRKDFLRLEGTILVVNIATGFFAIYLAYNNYSYYALIYREMLKSILLFIVNFYHSKFKCRLSFNGEGMKLIFRYSSFQFLFNFINYFSRNLDNILIGRYMGVTSLGFYDRAYRLMLYPVQTLTFVITPVLHPVLAEYQDKPDIIHDNYKKILEFLAFIGMPLSIFLCYSAAEITILLYGEQWVGSIPVFEILALTIWIQMTLSSTGAIFQALGKTNLLFISGLISAVFTVSGIAYGILENSLEMIGYGLLVSYGLNYFQVFYLLFVKAFKKPIFQYLRFFKVGFVSAFILIVLLTVSKNKFPNMYVSLFVKILLFMFSLLSGALIAKKEYIKLFTKRIRK